MAHTSESLQAAFSYLFLSEVAALKWLAQSLPPNPVVVNIGAGAGTSGLAFMESRPDLFMITIDIQKEDSPLGCLVAEANVLIEAGYGNYPRRWLQFYGDSKDYGKSWKDVCYRLFDNVRNGIATYKADLVFVDGDHTYNGCKGDILAWLPNIKPGGIMAVHDYNKREVFKDGPIERAPHPKLWQGVDRAVRKFLCPRYEIILQVDTLIAFEIGEQK